VNIALFASQPASIARLFIARHREKLSKDGVQIRVLVLDENASKRQNPVTHAWKIARRQAKIAGCSGLTSLARIAFYKGVNRLSTLKSESTQLPPLDDVGLVSVPTLNSDYAIKAVRSRYCDLVCLMGTRILRKDTLCELDVPTINIHSSDPGFVRGGPPVFWEVLEGLDHITLTIHDVVAELDAGHVLMQRTVPIEYCGGLGMTIRKTMRTAESSIADLFREVILAMKDGRERRTPNGRGPLRVTPSIKETWKAEMLCRSRTAHRS